MNPIFRPTILGGKIHRPYRTVFLPSVGPCDFVAHLKTVLPVPSPLPTTNGPSPFAEHLSAALPSYALPPTPQELSLSWWRSVRPGWKEDKSRGAEKNWAPLTGAMDRLVMVDYDLNIFYQHTFEKGVKDDRVLTVGDVLQGFAALLKKRLSSSQRSMLRDQQILETGRLRAGGGYSHNGTQRDLLKACPKGLRGKNNLVVGFGGVERDGTVKLTGWWMLIDRGSADPPPQEVVKPVESRNRGRDEEELTKPDIRNLIRCNSHLHDRFVGHLYREIFIYFPDPMTRLKWTGDDYVIDTKKPVFAHYSAKGLFFVRNFSVLILSNIRRKNKFHAVRKADCDMIKYIYTKLLLPVSKNDGFTRFLEDGKTPFFMPQVLENSRNLVSLSIDLNVSSAGSKRQNYTQVQLPHLQKIRLFIRETDESFKVAYTLLEAAPNLTDVDISLTFRRGGQIGPLTDAEDEMSHLNPNSITNQKNPPDLIVRRRTSEYRNEVKASFDYSILAKLTQLQRLEVSDVDLAEILPSLQIGNLRGITFRYCSNWGLLAAYAVKNPLHLKHLHVTAEPAELPAIKSFFDNGLEAGLETLILTVHLIEQECTVLSTIRKTENRLNSIYFLNKQSVLKHAPTLQNIAFYFAMGRDDGFWEPECLTRYISALTYLQNIRQMLDLSHSLRELSLVVPVMCVRDDMSEIEIDSFRGLRLDTIEVLYLFPTSWSSMVHYTGTDGATPEYSIQWVIIDFLEAAFQHYTERPKLKYVIFGLRNHVLPPSEYKIEWLEGVTQQEKEMEDSEYCDRDGYTQPADSEGTWSLEVLSYDDHPEETSGELFFRDWLEATNQKRLKRKKAGVYPVKWNPHLHGVDIPKTITHNGPKDIPFRLYSARVKEEENHWIDTSMIQQGLSMY
ncbi:hypothetical protein TWF506_004735 [Arthrobotrys conoides]|uniref:Uncharacterized protein n=1 Tax=Arthrobotrys conoides TaxID=74498 RepID=A0AAN8N270_9PEZI